MSSSQPTIEELKQRIDALNEAMDQLTYAVTHDLRAPLRAVTGFSQVLREELGPTLSKEHQHYLDRIQEGATKLSQLIDGFLEQSRTIRSRR